MQREKKDAKKLLLHFQLLSFGDGTGFWGTEGMAVPHPPDTKSKLDNRLQQENNGDLTVLTSPASWAYKHAKIRRLLCRHPAMP